MSKFIKNFDEFINETIALKNPTGFARKMSKIIAAKPEAEIIDYYVQQIKSQVDKCFPESSSNLKKRNKIQTLLDMRTKQSLRKVINLCLATEPDAATIQTLTSWKKLLGQFNETGNSRELVASMPGADEDLGEEELDSEQEYDEEPIHPTINKPGTGEIEAPIGR